MKHSRQFQSSPNSSKILCYAQYLQLSLRCALYITTSIENAFTPCIDKTPHAPSSQRLTNVLKEVIDIIQIQNLGSSIELKFVNVKGAQKLTYSALSLSSSGTVCSLCLRSLNLTLQTKKKSATNKRKNRYFKGISAAVRVSSKFGINYALRGGRLKS